jgi:RNA polymerase sigma-54 factor
MINAACIKINYFEISLMCSQSLNIGMRQSMNLTLALRQSINILQMSSVELTQMLSREVENNPFLEDSVSGDRQEDRYDNMRVSKAGENFDSMTLIADEKTLLGHVTEQVGRVVSTSIERMIAAYLVNLLQESGYIDLDIDQACKDLKISENQVLDVLSKLQTIEPTGIFARNLQECLTLQLKDRGEYNDIFKIILENLRMLAMHDMSKLAKLCKIERNELAEYIKEIKLLNPKPCSGFAHEKVSSRVADVILTIEDGEIKVSINDEVVPRLNVNKGYYLEVKSCNLGADDKEFISTHYHGANNVMRAVTQRLNTIKEVATAIAQKQKDFFLKGVMYLKPMTLAEIAYVCGMNESTISRATSNKYIQTPTGIYDMKFFFTSKIQSKNSAANVSSTKVKEIIKSIIDSEDSGAILSDDDIAESLVKFNINIARRTVAKYREAMGIQTSSMRKRIARSAVA